MKVRGSVAAALVAGVVVTPAHSQEVAQATASAPAAPGAPDEERMIVVTGTKKRGDSTVFDAALSVSAFGEAQLKTANVGAVSDIGNMVPNVYLNSTITTPGTAAFSIRGMALYSTIPSATPAVGVFVDGVYLGANAGADLNSFDLAGIEVLRGPQGLLFGRNVTGGAILLRTTTPGDELKMNFRAGIESGPEYTASGTVSVPILPDGVLSAKIGGYYKKDEGYFHNLANGNDDLGESETAIGRVAIAFRPTSGVESVLRYEHGRVRGDGPAGQNHRAFSRTSFDVAIDEEGKIEIDWDQFIWETKIGVGFGDGEIVNIFGYRTVDQFGLTDIDSTPLALFNANTVVEQNQYSNELRYSGKFGSFDLTIGGFYYTDNLKYLENRSLALGAVNVTGGGKQKSETWALFGNLDFKVSDELTFNAGARYSEEEKTAFVNRLVPSGPSNQCQLLTRTCSSYSHPVFSFPNANFADNRKTWGAFTPKLGVEWRPSPQTHFYGFWTRGFRSGGYNLRLSSAIAPGVPGPYDQEVEDSFEFGVKHRAFNDRLIVSGAVFHNNFKKLQRDVAFLDQNLGTLQLTANAADVIVEGAEFEVDALLGGGWNLKLNGGYISARNVKVLFDLSGNGTIGPEDYNLRIPFVSPWSYGVSLMYRGDLLGGVIDARASYNHRDTAASNDPNTGILNPLDNVDANVTFEFPNSNWSLSVFGKNLLNKATFGVDTPLPFNNPAVSPFGNAVQTFSPLNKGRVFGANIAFRY